MADWLSYRLSDFLLFSPRTYFRLYELYNEAVWPAHLVAFAVGLAVLACLVRPTAVRGRIAAGLLAACWLWVAVAFHLQRYATINWAALHFAAAFAVQSALLLGFAAFGRPSYRPTTSIVGRFGLGLTLFAVAVQPLVGVALGRSWREAELFGLAPDPTAVATLGALLLAPARARWLLMPIPLAWCGVSAATARAMASPDAWLLPLIMLLALAAAAACRLRRRI
jgi:hypothetical protein